MQNEARFKVANNVYQTIDDYMVPRFSNDQYLSGFVNSAGAAVKVIHVSQYKRKPFIIGVYNNGGVEEFSFYYDSVTPLPWHGLYAGLPYIAPDMRNLGIQSQEAIGCLFFNVPSQGLFKFDGVSVIRAGVPTPTFSCVEYASSGTTWARVINHRIDFEGNIVNSGYTQFPCTPDGAGNITLRLDSGATDIVGSTNVSPKNRYASEVQAAYENYFIIASSIVNDFGTMESTVTTLAGYNYVTVGAYVLVSTEALVTTDFGKTYAIAMKVKSFTATQVVLDLNDIRYFEYNNRIWQKANSTTYVPSFTYATNTWASVWQSDGATNEYYYRGIAPVIYLSPVSYTHTVQVTVSGTIHPTNCFNLVPLLSSIYEVNYAKSAFPIGLKENLSFTVYSGGALESIVISNENEIFFTDNSEGGAFEMTTNSDSAVVGSGDDGPIQAVCGATDFLLVSRQQKNYYVSGDLARNSRVNEISQTSVGVYSNESAISCLDKIIFVNKVGVWALYAGGKCEEVSLFTKGLFGTFSGTTQYNEETYWDTSSLPNYATILDSTKNKWLRVRQDIFRKLVFFCLPDGKILVLNLNNGEFYTWSGLITTLYDFEVIEGSYYLVDGDIVAKEDKTSVNKYDYFSSDAPVLEKTWFTGGEPSLEKKINQVKIWGQIVGDVAVSHKLDWNDTSFSDGNYTGVAGNFSHKKRVGPANAQAVSVKLVLGNNVTKFEIEGMELEFQPLQQSMKR